MIQIAASLLAANPLYLADEIKSLEGIVDRLHLDVMDGHFVPNLALSVDTIQNIPEQYLRDIHLMVIDPVKVARWLHLRATDTVYFHPQTPVVTTELIDMITGLGALPGLVIDLDYPLETNMSLLAQFHAFLVMGVRPGFSGQAFNVQAIDHVSWLKMHFPDAEISVDGGINANNAAQVVAAGAEVLVTGGYLFQSTDKATAVQSLKH